MKIRFDRFPQGFTKAITLSFDDGRTQDRRFVEKINEYGLKSTFHLNSGFFGVEGYVTADEVNTLYAGHEVSIHTTHHPFLEQSPQEQIIYQIVEDRRALESIVRVPIRGMSYPFGTYNESVVAQLQSIGIEYARTVASHGTYYMPSNFLTWHPTCHHKQMLEHVDPFLSLNQRHSRMSLLYIWGHSYEFDNDQNWGIIDQFGERVAGNPEIWFATNAEIVAYMKALQALRFTMDCSIVHNPTASDVWFSVNDQVVQIKAGQLVDLTKL